MWQYLPALALTMGVPTAVTGLLFWFLQRKIERREKVRDDREAAMKKNEILIVRSIGAAIALSEAAALALKRGSCNGETEAALEYARQIKREQKDFLTAQGIENIYQ